MEFLTNTKYDHVITGVNLMDDICAGICISFARLGYVAKRATGKR